MKSLFLAVGALAVSGVALAQGVDYAPCGVEVRDAGVLHLATGQLFSPGGTASLGTNPQTIFNNTCPTGFFSSLLSGSTIIDDGRVPSLTSPSPNAGTRSSHRVTSYQIAYCTRELRVSLGGPGATVRTRFFGDYDDCADLVTAGTPDADFTISGLPASATLGTLICWSVTIDLTGGNEFCLKADADGDFDNSATLDGFGYALGMPGQTGTTTATVGGFILAGDLTAPGNCAEGAGTYYNSPLVAGTGLDNDDLFRREGSGTQTSGCFFFGGPPSPHAGFHMLVTADLDDCTCLPNDADNDGTTDCSDGCPLDPNKAAPGACGCGILDTDTDGDAVPDCIDNCPAIANPGQEDCNANAVGDTCDIASSYSLDVNTNTLPDECEPGPGTPFCFGDGTGAACPCGNTGGTGEGCGNSTGNGALLYNGGGASVSAKDTALFTVRTPQNILGLVFMGDTTAGGGLGVPLFDGLLCVGGNTLRFPVRFSGTTGTIVLIDPVSSSLGLITSGSTWYFTTWHRDAAGPCGTSANFSNGLQVDFQP